MLRLANVCFLLLWIMFLVVVIVLLLRLLLSLRLLRLLRLLLMMMMMTMSITTTITRGGAVVVMAMMNISCIYIALLFSEKCRENWENYLLISSDR